MKATRFVIVALLALFLTACGGQEKEVRPVSPERSPVASPTLPPLPTPGTPSAVTSPPAATGVAISFITEDNLTIKGRLFGSG